MLLAGLLGMCAAVAGVTPAVEGRDLYTVADPAFEGNGLGGGLFVEARGLGTEDAVLAGTGLAAWTFRPLRLAVAVPGEARADHVDGFPPRLDALFVLSDRRKGGLGVAGAFDLPLPFLPNPDRPASGRLALGVGMAHTAVVVNLGAPFGRPLDNVVWSVGASAPFVGETLSGFAELEGEMGVRVSLDQPSVHALRVRMLRAGLHLTPVEPLVVTFSVGGHPAVRDVNLSGGVAWIPRPKERRPSVEGLDSDRDGVGDAVDACPREREDDDGGNDADGCPDGGTNIPLGRNDLP